MGFIKIDRKLKDWQWSSNPNMVAIWLRLLLEANYQENQVKGLKLKKGQLVTTIKKLAEKVGLSQQQTRTCLLNLQTTNEITIKTTNKYSIITIVKWEEYQVSNKSATNKITSKKSLNQQTNNKQTNKPYIYKEIKNIRNKEIDEDIKNRYLEAGYSKELVEDCLKTMSMFDIDGEENFKKILAVFEQEDIINKQGYIYTMRKDLQDVH